MRHRRRYYYNNFGHTNTSYSTNQKENEIEKKKGTPVGVWVFILILIIAFTINPFIYYGFPIFPTIAYCLAIAAGIFAVTKNKIKKSRIKKEGASNQ